MSTSEGKGAKSGADAALSDLAAPDVDDAVAARIRRRGHVALARSTRLARTPALAKLDRAYTRALEPALVGAAALVYLVWAFARVLHFI